MLATGVSAFFLRASRPPVDAEPGLGAPELSRPGPGGPGLRPLRVDLAAAYRAASRRSRTDGDDNSGSSEGAEKCASIFKERAFAPHVHGADGRGRVARASTRAAEGARREGAGSAAATHAPRAAAEARTARRARTRLAAANAARRASRAALVSERERRRDGVRVHRSAATASRRAGRSFASRAGGRRGGFARAASLFDPVDGRARSQRRPRRRRQPRRPARRPARSPLRRRTTPRAARPPRAKLLRLGAALGAKRLSPPEPGLEPPPVLLSLPERGPVQDPAGLPTPRRLAGLDAAENLNPAQLPRDRRRGPHWDDRDWHDGPARGLDRDGAWLWTYRDRGRVWALAGSPAAPLVRQGPAWWLRRDGMWFVVHDGQPWVWRHFADWGAQGLFQPGTGVKIVYSADFSRAAVITPGSGAQVFDADSGEFLGTIPQESLPPTRRPRAPASLPVPE